MKEIIKKLKFRDIGIVINAPYPLKEGFSEYSFKTLPELTKTSSNTLLFANSSSDLLAFLNTQIKNIVPDSLFWIAYPKGTSKIKTAINRDTIR